MCLRLTVCSGRVARLTGGIILFFSDGDSPDLSVVMTSMQKHGSSSVVRGPPDTLLECRKL
jgi:hypothetical protein